MSRFYPLRLSPLLQPRVWGRRDWAAAAPGAGPSNAPIGEIWEVHEGALVENGPCAGASLGELSAADARAYIGEDFAQCRDFPLLVKRLAVADWLSVQVHPNDAQARRFAGAPRGKEEAWVILETHEAEAELILGLRAGSTKADLAHAVADANRWPNLLRRVRVRAGAVLHIPPGTVHAIGPGISLYEIQQNSDITYRLYDWERLGLDGRPRALQTAHALQSANLLNRPAVHYPPGPACQLLEAAKFQLFRHRVEGECRLDMDTGGHCCHLLTCTAGQLCIHSAAVVVTLSAGSSALIPAALGRYSLVGAGEVLRAMPRAIG